MWLLSIMAFGVMLFLGATVRDREKHADRATALRKPLRTGPCAAFCGCYKGDVAKTKTPDWVLNAENALAEAKALNAKKPCAKREPVGSPQVYGR
ncbi:MAG: hypothetical protein OJF48_004502 [Afipia sp.]|nr:MAG: hypothetical protein OJF48_004502 [Afipia sp.]